jgi:integrase
MTPLRQRMLEDMQVRNLSALTQRAYLEHVSRFARHFGASPARLGPEEIRAYQVYLTNEKQLAPASIVITVAALRFLYTVTLRKPWSGAAVIPAPKMPQTLPVVLSPAEVVRFLESVKIPTQRVILTTCYAAGLRVSEAVHLTIPAIDSQRMVLRIEQGKGQKDRYVMLSPKLLEILRDWWRVRRPRHWLFPGDRPGCPMTTRTVDRACQRAHRRSGLAKPVTPHSLRSVSTWYPPFKDCLISTVIRLVQGSCGGVRGPDAQPECEPAPWVVAGLCA